MIAEASETTSTAFINMSDLYSTKSIPAKSLTCKDRFRSVKCHFLTKAERFHVHCGSFMLRSGILRIKYLCQTTQTHLNLFTVSSSYLSSSRKKTLGIYSRPIYPRLTASNYVTKGITLRTSLTNTTKTCCLSFDGFVLLSRRNYCFV